MKIAFNDRSLEERKALEHEEWQYIQENPIPIVKPDFSNESEFLDALEKHREWKADFRKRHNLPD